MAPAGWPKRPPGDPPKDDRGSSGSSIIFRFIVALIAIGMLIGAWQRPPLQVFGQGSGQAVAGSWTPLTYGLSAAGVFALLVWLIFFWKD